MSESTNEPFQTSLPEELKRRFADLRKRLWKLETLTVFSVAACASLASLGLLFLSDRFWDSPAWVRLALLLSSTAAAGTAAAVWIHRWMLKPRDLKELAQLVQTKYKRLGDRLLGIVELADEKHRPAQFSPALYHAAIHQVAAQAEPFDFAAAANPAKSKRLAQTAGVLAILALALAIVFPQAASNTLKRWVKPLATIPPYRFVEITDLPDQKVVPHGEPFQIPFQVEYRSFWRPNHVRAQFGDQAPIETRVENGRALIEIPSQFERAQLTIRLGDALKDVTIVPAHRPSLTKITARLTLPNYLQYPALEADLRRGSLRLLEGTSAAFHGEASQVLQKAMVFLEDKEGIPLLVRSNKFQSQPVDLGAALFCSFVWEDEFGLTNSVPWRLTIEPVKDQPPTPEIRDLPRDLAILETEVLAVRTIANDDFGVREIGLDWNIPSDPALAALQSDMFPYQYGPSSTREKTVEQEFYLSPSLLGIPSGATVELTAYALDFLPERERVHSPAYRIYILDNEQHAEWVRQRLEALLTQLEEITRLEESVRAQTRDAKLNPQAPEAELAAKLDQAVKDQNQNANELDQLARQGMDALREALRNPTFSEETLTDWTKTLQGMQELSRSKMQQAASSLKAAQRQPSERDAALDQALETEQQILDELTKLQAKVNEGLDQLQAITLAERLRKVGAEEKEISSELQLALPKSVGLVPQELPPDVQKLNENLAEQQSEVREAAEVLHGEISRFFERTKREAYGKVSQAMTDERAPEELHRLQSMISENISFQAAQNLQAWAAQFNEWADLLKPPPGEEGGAGGAGQGSTPAQDPLQQLMAILRLRERELNLRQQTQLLESRKRRAGELEYNDAAGTLASNQETIAQDLAAAHERNELPFLNEPFLEARLSMQQAHALLQEPRTDVPTVQAQTRSIQVLSDLINLLNEQSKNDSSAQGGGSGEQAQMSFLLQMMAPAQMNAGEGQEPGSGSSAGGSTSNAASGLEGSATGAGATRRDILKTSGGIQNLPAEFREPLERYYRALEQLEQQNHNAPTSE